MSPEPPVAPHEEAPARAPRMSDRSGYLGATISIAAAAGFGNMASNFWVPFLPLYLLDLGAKSYAEAVFWVAVAMTGQGVARLFTGPLWGILSDRYGRKIMFLRSLYASTGATLIAFFITDPWQIAFALTFHGLFSGFVPAAVALTSVTVPDTKLNTSLRWVAGAQYMGSTLGPAIGAGLAIAFGYRGAILWAAALPSLAATTVLFVVPKDHVASRSTKQGTAPAAQNPFLKLLSWQLTLALFLYFLLFALPNLLRLITPAALQEIGGEEGTKATVGLAMTVGGVASLAGIAIVSGRYIAPGNLRVSLAIAALVAGAGHVMLAVSNVVPLYIFWFAMISLAQAAMLPATNTLIAAHVPRARRGTAFGLAGGGQALAFMIGPMTAALFAAVSLDWGFVTLGVLLAAVAVLVFIALREPALEKAAAGE